MTEMPHNDGPEAMSQTTGPIEPVEPSRPGGTGGPAHAAPVEGPSQGMIALLTAGGLALLLGISLGVAALVGRADDSARPAALRQTPAPVVPMNSDQTSPEPSATGQPSTAPSATASAARSTPAAPKTTKANSARVVSASVSLNPKYYFGRCGPSVPVDASVKITVSTANALVKYTVNGVSGRQTPSGTTVTDTLRVPVAIQDDGTYTVKLTVEAPTASSATTTLEVRCK
jgi:hypothetical protein